MLVTETVTQDDRIVDGKCKLQDHSNGIGNKGNGAAKEIGSHI